METPNFALSNFNKIQIGVLYRIQDFVKNFGGGECKFGEVLEKCQNFNSFFLYFLGQKDRKVIRMKIALISLKK